jgi:hypothetical protein
MTPPCVNFVLDSDGTLTDGREDIAAAQLRAMKRSGCPIAFSPVPADNDAVLRSAQVA